jgi:ribosome biogenesis protein UTP30
VQTLKASNALLAFIKATKQAPSGKPNLLAHPDLPTADTPIWLTLATKKHIHDTRRLKPGKISLPNPLNTDESTICLITADPQHAYKSIVASEEFPEALRVRVTRVVDLAHLKTEFKAYEAQRKLYNEHDVFLADDRIINRLPKALGKTFYKTTTKRPVPVVLQAKRERVEGKLVARPKGKETQGLVENVSTRPVAEIVAEIQKASGAAFIHLSPSTNTSVKVGYGSWTAEHLSQNIEKVSLELVERFVPQKWRNVRSIYIKGPTTAALPIWQTDELWADESQIVPDGEASLKAPHCKREPEVKPTIREPSLKAPHGKRKPEVELTVKERPKKKAKKRLLN